MASRPPSAHRRGPPRTRTARRPAQASLAEWTSRAVECLERAGIGSPRADVRRLTEHGLGLTWMQVLTRMREPLDAHRRVVLDGLVARRAVWEPLAYITGLAGFCGLELEVGPGVLVPRPETERLVEVAMQLLQDVRTPVVVDLGTGSGAIALAIKTRRPDANVVATDSSRRALAYAHRNVKKLGLRVEVLHGDLFAPLHPSMQGAVDLVVSNPPYIPFGREDLLGRDVVREPSEALFAGEAGDEVLLRILARAPRWLRPGGGAVACEVGTHEQALGMYKTLVEWRERGLADDLSGRPRVVWGRP